MEKINVFSLKLPSREEFIAAYNKREPVVVKGVDIGVCRQKWTVDYLASNGEEKKVTIHVCQKPQMDFINKNFLYKTLPFADFVKRASGVPPDSPFISKDEKYYLRSLGENPRKHVADVKKDFPLLADDIIFPDFYPQECFFSSVFRIASKGVQLWTHYDIMDNFLIVVSGRKKVVLFKPSDAHYIYLNGDKSEVLDIDNPDLNKYPKFVKATRYECVLEPGDILFIPALWFHNVINEEWGVAVNVFWRHLDSKFYDSKDIYGNRDLVPYSHAMQALDRAITHLNTLPQDYRDFYARRMVQKLESKTYKKDESDLRKTPNSANLNQGDNKYVRKENNATKAETTPSETETIEKG